MLEKSPKGDAYTGRAHSWLSEARALYVHVLSPDTVQRGGAEALGPHGDCLLRYSAYLEVCNRIVVHTPGFAN